MLKTTARLHTDERPRVQSRNQFTIGGHMRHILLDLKTGEVFSHEHGWNKLEASIRPSEVWMHYLRIARAQGYLSDGSWEGRILVAVPLPHEQEEET